MSSNESKTVVLFKAESQYDVLNFFIDEVSSSFQKEGFCTCIVDFQDDNWVQTFHEVVNKPNVVLYFSFNAVGHNLIFEGKYFFESCQVPFWCFMVDHPFYHIERLQFNYKNAYFSFVDQSHIHIANSLFPNMAPRSKVFLPQGCSYAESDLVPIEAREIDIFFAGSYQNPDAIRRQWATGGEDHPLDIVAERALYDLKNPIISILVEVFTETGFDLNSFKVEDVMALSTLIDNFVRQKRREVALQALQKLNVVVYSNNWQEFPRSTNSKIVFHNSTNYKSMKDNYKNAKIVLNVLPNYVYGLHDRVLDSSLSGAVCLSDENDYLKSEFTDGVDILLYNFTDMSSLHDRVGALLETPCKLQSIVENARTKVISNHTWLNRVQQIIKISGI